MTRSAEEVKDASAMALAALITDIVRPLIAIWAVNHLCSRTVIEWHFLNWLAVLCIIELVRPLNHSEVRKIVRDSLAMLNKRGPIQ